MLSTWTRLKFRRLVKVEAVFVKTESCITNACPNGTDFTC